jgi:hypothetical protein
MTADQLSAAALWGIPAATALITIGGLWAMINQLKATVVAVHRRIDELENMMYGIREVLIARGWMTPMRSTRSRPPLTDDDQTPS